jgi:hypothetical protein
MIQYIKFKYITKIYLKHTNFKGTEIFYFIDEFCIGYNCRRHLGCAIIGCLFYFHIKNIHLKG